MPYPSEDPPRSCECPDKRLFSGLRRSNLPVPKEGGIHSILIRDPCLRLRSRSHALQKQARRERVTLRHAIGDLCPSSSSRADSASRQRDASLVLHCAHRPPCFPSWAQTILFASFCGTSARCAVVHSQWIDRKRFWHQDMPRPAPRDRPQEAGNAVRSLLDKIHVDSPLFSQVHFDGQVPNPTLLPGAAQWGFWRASVCGQWPRKRQHRPCDAVCA